MKDDLKLSWKMTWSINDIYSEKCCNLKWILLITVIEMICRGSYWPTLENVREKNQMKNKKLGLIYENFYGFYSFEVKQLRKLQKRIFLHYLFQVSHRPSNPRGGRKRTQLTYFTSRELHLSKKHYETILAVVFGH